MPERLLGVYCALPYIVSAADHKRIDPVQVMEHGVERAVHLICGSRRVFSRPFRLYICPATRCESLYGNECLLFLIYDPRPYFVIEAIRIIFTIYAVFDGLYALYHQPLPPFCLTHGNAFLKLEISDGFLYRHVQEFQLVIFFSGSYTAADLLHLRLHHFAQDNQFIRIVIYSIDIIHMLRLVREACFRQSLSLAYLCDDRRLQFFSIQDSPFVCTFFIFCLESFQRRQKIFYCPCHFQLCLHPAVLRVSDMCLISVEGVHSGQAVYSVEDHFM